MRNEEVFNTFDMVVALEMSHLNVEMRHLLQSGFIPKTFIVGRDQDDNSNFRYQRFDDAKSIPDGFEYIQATAFPQIEIDETGTQVVFLLHLGQGTAGFWEGSGSKAHFRTYPVENWSYGVKVNLNLTEVEAKAIHDKKTVPPLVAEQLHRFTDDMFRIDRLFLDFASVDLRSPDAARTSVGGAPKKVYDDFLWFMQFYLQDLAAHGNPYNLGYTVLQRQATPQSPVTNVPPILQPSGTTFNVYYDPSSPARSTVNYVLVTHGGHATIPGSAPLFNATWSNRLYTYVGTMNISHACLVEPMIVRPIFNRIHDQVYAQIAGKIDCGPGNAYETAKHVHDVPDDPNGPIQYWRFEISNKNTDDDQYVNWFEVHFHNFDPMSAMVTFTGHIEVYKEESRRMGVCTARAWASEKLDWNAQVSIHVGKDAAGHPVLQLSITGDPVRRQSDHNTNSCADRFNFIGDIIGGLGGVFEVFHIHFFKDLIGNVFTMDSPGIGNLSLALQNLSNSVAANFVMPAGNVMGFSGVQVSPYGDICLWLQNR